MNDSFNEWEGYHITATRSSIYKECMTRIKSPRQLSQIKTFNTKTNKKERARRFVKRPATHDLHRVVRQFSQSRPVIQVMKML